MLGEFNIDEGNFVFDFNMTHVLYISWTFAYVNLSEFTQTPKIASTISGFNFQTKHI